MQPDDVPQVDAETAAEHLARGDALFVDVRDPASFEAAHVPGAVHVDDGAIEAFLAETARDRKVIVYCYHGFNSLGGAAFLLAHGFTDVASLSGGFEGWRGESRPTSTSS